MRRGTAVWVGLWATIGVWLPLASAQAVEGLRGDATNVEAQPFVARELLIKLGPRAAARAHEGLQRGFAASLGDADAHSLDAVLAKHRAKRLRRLFSQLEDRQGTLRATASQRVATLRQRYAARARRVRSPQGPPQLDALYVLELDAAADVRVAAAELATLADVEYAEPNWIYQLSATPLPALPFVPDDRFVTQDSVHWSQGAWGQSFLDLWGIEKIRAIGAWNAFDADHSGAFEPGETKPGEGVLVAVIDTGVDHLHPDLAANVWTNPGEIPSNGVDDDGNGRIDDVRGWNFATGTSDTMDAHGHGTHVAGTVAAAVGGSTGVAGVAPWARIMPVPGLDSEGRGSASQLAEAVIYAAETGADILSNSWGGPESAILADAFAFADSVGAIAVASAGNGSTGVQGISPANLPSVIAVAALEPDDAKASFSNFGLEVDIAAPGTGVLSLNARGGNNAIAHQVPERVVETHYIWLDGTSMACPHVSGALAVLMSRFPGDSADELRGRLRAGARNIDAVNPDFAGLLGSGALDLEGSVAATPTPIVEIEDAIPRSLPIGGGPFSLVVHLRNFWAQADEVVASLASSDPNVTISDGTASFGDIAVGETRSNESDPFQLTLAPTVAAGSSVEFELSVQATGYARTLPLRLAASFFEDATAASGLPRSEFVSFHVLFDDYSGDRLPDIALIGFLNFRLFRNLGGGRFANAGSETGVFPTGGAANVSLFADLDDDGDRDIVLGSGGSATSPSQYFEYPGSLPFLDRSVASGIHNKQFETVIAVDYDRDGRLDVLGGDQAKLVLLRNNGNGTFSDLTTASNFRVNPSNFNGTRDMLAFDCDNDGDPDVAGLTGYGFFLLRNRGDGTFENVLTSGIYGGNPGAALDAGDYDNDGDLDLFLSGLDKTLERNALYRNNGNGTFMNVTAQSGDLALVAAKPWTRAVFFDFDNDTDLDLFVDAEGIPNEVHYDVLYRNDGAGRFTIVNGPGFPPGFGPGGGTGAIADYDRDGSLDLYAPDGNFGGTGQGGLLRNRIGALNHFIRIDLEGRPRDPLGARVRVVAGGISQIRELHTGGVETTALHFGLGQATAIERVEIRWPDGRLQRIADVAADQEIEFVEQGVFCTGTLDGDSDGVLDSCDNCAAVANAGQDDADADGVGDVCNDAADGDGDEWSGALDVCPGVFDPGQEDADGDGVGDACLAEVPALPIGAWWVAIGLVLALAGRAFRRRVE